MVYRFKPSEKKHETREKKPYRRAGADSPHRLYGHRVDEIDLSTLFELKKLEGRVGGAPRLGALFGKLKTSLKKFKRTAWAALVGFIKGAREVCRALGDASLRAYRRVCRFLEKRRAERREVKDFYILSGALTAVILVALLSVFAVLYKLIFSEYFGSFEKITVPDMVGMSYADAREMLDEENYNVTVSYEYSTFAEAGVVVSQYPFGGAERKIFGGGSLPTLSIVVSRGRQMIEVGDLVGKSERDAILELKNSGLTVKTVEEYSSSVTRGSVISTSPAAGKVLEVGGLVVLRVSLGQKKVMARVPDVVGLTEAEAISRISAAALTVGKIKYESSSVRAGLVISQSAQSGAELEKGSEISFSVSAGKTFTEKTVPSLYGLTLGEARERLADYGLVLGNVYAAPSGEKKGTVIAQSPAAGASITASVVSVDVYVGA